MPRKTIYVSEEDLPIFEKAEKLGDNSLSAVIAEALKRFVEVKEAEAKGFSEITLGIRAVKGEMGVPCNLHTVKFIGRELARGCDKSDLLGSRGVDYVIYQTRKGKILLYVNQWSMQNGEADKGYYKIFDTLEELQKNADVPTEVVKDAAKALEQEITEYLDI
ncbi:MAG: hypothetical protein H0Z24_03135 [Thermosipho sp. (in: Bacteria)]|nr:hypothetical protein [Thermosipho sp. (in: thermotogales)]